MKKFSVNNLKFKGMGIVEVVVAIAISAVTLTGAATFSVALKRRAQQNFVELSILQLQSLITEELRLIELGLKKNVKEGLKFSDQTDFLYANRIGNSSINWAEFCNQQAGVNASQYVSITLPDFSNVNADHKISLTRLTEGSGVESMDNVEGLNDVLFSSIPSNVQFGAFANMDAKVAIRKYIDDSDSGGAGLGNTLKFKIIVYYNIFGNDRNFTISQDVTMIHALVCKQP